MPGNYSVILGGLLTVDAEIKRPMSFDGIAFDRLLGDPNRTIRGVLDGNPFTATIAIPHYDERIARHYCDIAPDGLKRACRQADIPFELRHFGLVVSFAVATEIAIHDTEMALDESVRRLVGSFGPVVFRNAHIESSVRERFHRNIFPHLKFHVDRNSAMPNQFSCFTRDPFDAEQRRPRASSTVFVANIVAWLEMVRSGRCAANAERGVRASYELFNGQDMAPLLENVVFEQPWSEPDGIGEIAIIDNRTVLHATYHKDGMTSGYRIGARYLF